MPVKIENARADAPHLVFLSDLKLDRAPRPARKIWGQTLRNAHFTIYKGFMFLAYSQTLRRIHSQKNGLANFHSPLK